MKVSTLDKEAVRGYKCTTLIRNLLSLPVIVDNKFTITFGQNQHKCHKRRQTGDVGVHGTAHQIMETETKICAKEGKQTLLMYLK